MSTETAVKKEKYIIHNNTVYEQEDNEFFSGWRPVKVPLEEPKILWKKKKISVDLWFWMVAWCQVTQGKFKSETLVQLLYNIDEDKWEAWIPPQETAGMTVNALEKDPEYAKGRAQFTNHLMLGSLHHHCTSGAFQSGVDSSDEIDKDGIHFTIGNIGQDVHSIHARFYTQGVCHEVDASDFIDFGELDDSWACAKYIPEDTFQELQENILTATLSTEYINENFNFTEDLKKVKKKTYGYPATGKARPRQAQHFGDHYDHYPYYGKNVQNNKLLGTAASDSDSTLDPISNFVKEKIESYHEFVVNYTVDEVTQACDVMHAIVDIFGTSLLPEDPKDRIEQAYNDFLEKLTGTDEMDVTIEMTGYDQEFRSQLRRIYYKFYREPLNDHNRADFDVEAELWRLVTDLQTLMDNLECEVW